MKILESTPKDSLQIMDRECNYRVLISGTESYSEIDIQSNKVSNTVSQFNILQT